MSEDTSIIKTSIIFEYVNMIKELEAKLAIAIEALEYYAKGSLYPLNFKPGMLSEFGCGCCAGRVDEDSTIDPDSSVVGLTAREALQKIKGDKA